MLTINQTDTHFILSFPYDVKIKDAIKACGGARWNPVDKVWTLPIEKHAEVTMLSQRFGSSNVAQASDARYNAIPELPDLTIDIPLKRTLFPYQAKGVAQGLQWKRFINGDQPGLGKTTEAIATVVAAQCKCILVICPASLKLNWQKEFDIVAGMRAIILTPSVKNSWMQYYKVGFCKVFITNYESLKTYFVDSIKVPEGENMTLRHVKFRDTINLFDAVIVDELHRCFPYETKIVTNKGVFQIGEIVENNRTDLSALSFDFASKIVSFKSITNVWKNHRWGRRLFKLTHAHGELIATEDHEIYVGGRKKKIREIQSGEMLYLLRSDISNQQSRQDDGQILLQAMRVESSAGFNSNERIAEGYKSKEKRTKEGSEKMCLLRTSIRCKLRPSSQFKSSVLHSELLGKMAGKTAGNYSFKSDYRKTTSFKKGGYITNAKSGISQASFRQNESQQPDRKPRNTKENVSRYARQNFLSQRRQRKAYTATITASSSFTTSTRSVGIGYSNQRSKRSVSQPSQLLQSRYWNRQHQACHRSRWGNAQIKEVEVSRRQENFGLECVRVESCEVYEPTNIEQLRNGSFSNQTVYDIEVSDNHNYFANNILVSNCKETKTQWSKFTKGIASGKEYIIGLTGTPVVNKPKDLISQLGIINQLHLVGGYKQFIERYCGGDGKGATNLQELNYRISTTCFFQRKKKDVLKDLPDKTYQVITCDITTRKEYDEAINDLKSYLQKWKNKTDAEVEKSLRGEIMVSIGVCRNISARGKLNEAYEQIDEVIDAGEKIVVFIHQKEIAMQLLKRYPDAVTVRGDDSIDARDRNVSRFQRDPRCNIIICSIKAAGVGITLTASSTVLFIESPWHPADFEQCVDRTHRIGQKNAVLAKSLLGHNTIDEDIYQIVEAKRQIANAITGTEDNIVREVIDKLANSLFNVRNSQDKEKHEQMKDAMQGMI